MSKKVGIHSITFNDNSFKNKNATKGVKVVRAERFELSTNGLKERVE